MILKIILEHKETSKEEKNKTNGRDARYNVNIIKSHFSVQPVGSSLRPVESELNVIDDEPLPEKKRK